MLTVSKITHSAGAANYYEEKDNYYFNGTDNTQWFGSGATTLGLQGNVSKTDFIALLDGKLPNGSSLTHLSKGKNNHRAGYDFTFSAPKSVSVLALVAEDKKVLEAHKNAVTKALTEIELMTSTRTMHQGISRFEHTGNLIAALFLHDTSRNLDPQLHTHAVIANATQNHQGEWKTLSSDRQMGQGFVEVTWNNQVALGALYRQFLKEDLQQQGYQFITVGKNGQWEIKGVPTEPFSSRRKEIIDAVGEMASAKQKTVATLDTRQKKDFANIEAVRQEWKHKLHQSGFDKNTLIQSLTAEKPDPQQKITLQQAIQAAITQLEIHHSKFTYDKLLTQIINQIPFQPGMINKLRTEISQFIKQGILIPVNKNSTVLTSANQLKQENTVAQLISSLKEKPNGLTSAQNSPLITNIVKNGVDINLVNLKGDTTHHLNALMAIDSLAKENGRQHIIIVPNITCKKHLADEITSNIPIMTLKDIAQSPPKVEKTLFSLYQSEKIRLANIQPLLERVNQQNATAIIFDSGIGAQIGLTKAIAKNLDIAEIPCQQANNHKQLYFIEQVDKRYRPQLAANYYCRLYASNKQAIIQTGSQKLNNEITNKTRQTLIDRGLLSQQSLTVLNKKSIFLDAANRHSRNSYRVGNLLEKTTGEKKESFIIKEVDKETNTLLLLNSDQRYSRLAINKISPDYQLYRTEALELRIGDKVKSLTNFGKNIQGGKTFTITKLKPGNFLFRDSITMEDSNGNRVSFTNKTETKLDYHYCESLGNSFSRTKTVIAITNDRELNNTTINQIKRSGKTVLAITGHDKASIDKKIALNDVKMQAISKDNIDLANPSNSAQFTLDTDLKKAIDTAIDKVTGSQVFFNGAAAITKTYQLLPNSSFEQIVTEFEKRVTQGEFIAVDGSLNTLMGNFLAKTSFDREVMILKHILTGKNNQLSLIKPNQPIATAGLTPGQQKAAEKILRSSDQIIAIQGYAGVGKTTQFKTVAHALKHNRPDITLTGLAPTHKAVAELKAAGINSQTIASFLNENNPLTNFENSLFIIDESSMIGNKTYVTLLNNITAQGGRIVLAGDRQQLKSFESGVPFKLTLERSAADAIVMREIVRQTPALKPAIEAVIAGNIKQSLAVIASIPPTTVSRNRKSDLPTHSVIDLKEKKPDEKITAIVNDFTSRTKDARDNTLIVTPLNRDRKAINQAIHQTLYQQDSQSLTIPILQRVNHQPADLKMTAFWQANSGNIAKVNQTYYTIGDISPSGTLALEQQDNRQERYLSVMELNPDSVTLFQPDNITVSQGEKIRLTLTDKERLASNNETGIIKKISGDSLLIDFNGQELKYNPIQEMADRHLDYTYAVTAYASQGASVPYVIVYDGASDNKAKLAALDNTYVEFSRSKAHVQVYLDDAEKWINHIESHSGERLTAHELIKRQDDQLAASEKKSLAEKQTHHTNGLSKKNSAGDNRDWPAEYHDKIS
ncbi:MobF family relaxase (plasmid) [Arsenophonus sp. aPb]|uniref:MobF family relaxase n=1 Tax=Arsenophonus sp. aPb TaxID=3041619 RepID=UPI0024684BD9|nr:MobF family relaxase [Arsenophonus sp. aPb]WGL99761.1 MobF family relaxase [Arsenophonus sp. aPb]